MEDLEHCIKLKVLIVFKKYNLNNHNVQIKLKMFDLQVCLIPRLEHQRSESRDVSSIRISNYILQKLYVIKQITPKKKIKKKKL